MLGHFGELHNFSLLAGWLFAEISCLRGIARCVCYHQSKSSWLKWEREHTTAEPGQPSCWCSATLLRSERERLNKVLLGTLLARLFLGTQPARLALDTQHGNVRNSGHWTPTWTSLWTTLWTTSQGTWEWCAFRFVSSIENLPFHHRLSSSVRGSLYPISLVCHSKCREPPDLSSLPFPSLYLHIIYNCFKTMGQRWIYQLTDFPAAKGHWIKYFCNSHEFDVWSSSFPGGESSINCRSKVLFYL